MSLTERQAQCDTMTNERKKHLPKRPNNKTLLNILAIAAILIIVLAIGVFIGKTLTMNPSGNNLVPSSTPTVAPDDSNTIVLPSTSAVATVRPIGTPTFTASPLPSSTPTASPSATLTVTPTSTPGPSVAPSATPLPTITPLPTAEPSPYPTAPPQPTITPTPTPEIIPDTPFYQSITPLKPGDSLPSVSDQNTLTGDNNGPIFVDFAHSNMGSDYAYPGDTIGVQLRLYNSGPAINTVARVTLNVSMMITSYGQTMWIDTGVSKQFDTQITMGDYGSTYKNISYQVPDSNDPGLKHTYKIIIMFYVKGQSPFGVIKVFNIM